MDRYIKEVWWRCLSIFIQFTLLSWFHNSHSGINFTNIVFHLAEEVEIEGERKTRERE